MKDAIEAQQRALEEAGSVRVGWPMNLCVCTSERQTWVNLQLILEIYYTTMIYTNFYSCQLKFNPDKTF